MNAYYFNDQNIVSMNGKVAVFTSMNDAAEAADMANEYEADRNFTEVHIIAIKGNWIARK